MAIGVKTCNFQDSNDILTYDFGLMSDHIGKNWLLAVIAGFGCGQRLKTSLIHISGPDTKT